MLDVSDMFNFKLMRLDNHSVSLLRRYGKSIAVVSLLRRYGKSIAVVSLLRRYGKSIAVVSAEMIADPAAPVMSAHFAPALSHT